MHSSLHYNSQCSKWLPFWSSLPRWPVKPVKRPSVRAVSIFSRLRGCWADANETAHTCLFYGSLDKTSRKWNFELLNLARLGQMTRTKWGAYSLNRSEVSYAIHQQHQPSTGWSPVSDTHDPASRPMFNNQRD